MLAVRRMEDRQDPFRPDVRLADGAMLEESGRFEFFAAEVDPTTDRYGRCLRRAVPGSSAAPTPAGAIVKSFSAAAAALATSSVAAHWCPAIAPLEGGAGRSGRVEL